MAQPQASHSLADAARTATSPPTDPRLDPRRRRISYFMLVRLVMLAAFTLVAGVLAWQSHSDFSPVYQGFIVGTVVVGYGLTIIYAYLLHRVRDLDRFAWLQTTCDIILVAVVVQMSGGTDSGLVWLYLIAVLGAATMGGVGQTWAAAGTCALIFATTSTAEALGMLEPISLGPAIPALPPLEAAATFARTAAGLTGVAVLSSFLNKQVASSALQVGDLRAMNENILRSLSSGLIATDNEDRVLYFNPIARAILGLDDSDVQRPVGELLPGVEAQLRAAAAAGPRGATGPHGNSELEVTTRTGTRLHVGLSCSPLRDGQGEPVGQLINFQDVTRMHELAEQVRRGERLAAVGGLAASVAHEIRNPLAAISGSAELLTTAPLEHDDARLVKIISRESTRLSELISDMLAFTRPRTPQPAEVHLERVVRETLENFRADPANADVDVKLFSSEANTVRVDQAQLSQVLWNLLRNAAEAMEGSGHVELRVRARPEDDEVELSVADDGPGIPPEQLDRVFDPFFTTKERGTGFGLAIVHRVIEDNGGRVELSSSLGEGTTFVLRLAAIDSPAGEDEEIDQPAGSW